jgi:LPXTG-site transpeptidase (sortase) family protein
MPSDAPHHRAIIDENGDIVLPLTGGKRQEPLVREETMEMPVMQLSDLNLAHEIFKSVREEGEAELFAEQEEEDAKPVTDMHLPEWKQEEHFEKSETHAFLESLLERDGDAVYATMTAEASEEKAPKSAKPFSLGIRVPVVPLPGWSDIREKLYDVTSDLAEEAGKQYQASFVSSKKASAQMLEGSGIAVRRFWSFLAQPVWVPGRKNAPKKRSRGMLFFTDVFRFGGTFAALFAGLFLALNYQSFWDIVQAKLDPLSQTYAQGLGQEMTNDLSEKLRHVPTLATAGQSDGNLLSFLPPVGPPENRLIIPKMNLNVPIVIPTNDALMREDWKALEEDIQKGLENGVVHYPGTARPGQAGNFFLTGHSSYFPWAAGLYKSVFARLSSLNVGDEYWVYYGGDKHRYIVQEKKEVSPSDVTVLDQPLSKRISTLMTCTPVGTTLRRLIIKAQEVDAITGDPMAVGEQETREQSPQHKLDMLPI